MLGWLGVAEGIGFRCLDDGQCELCWQDVGVGLGEFGTVKKT